MTKFTTALSFTLLPDNRVAVHNGIGDGPIGHALPDDTFDEPLAEWVCSFPPEAACDFEEGITTDARLARQVLQPGWRMTLEPRVA